MFKDLLLGAETADAMLLCLPFVAGNHEELFEKHRQLCENQECICSDSHHGRLYG